MATVIDVHVERYCDVLQPLFKFAAGLDTETQVDSVKLKELSSFAIGNPTKCPELCDATLLSAATELRSLSASAGRIAVMGVVRRVSSVAHARQAILRALSAAHRRGKAATTELDEQEARFAVVNAEEEERGWRLAWASVWPPSRFASACTLSALEAIAASKSEGEWFSGQGFHLWGQGAQMRSLGLPQHSCARTQSHMQSHTQSHTQSRTHTQSLSHTQPHT